MMRFAARLRPLTRLLPFARRFSAADEGSGTIEFVLIFPVFAFIMMGGYEVGYYTVSSAMLDRGLDLAMRDVRLGRTPQVDLSSLKGSVCEYARFVRKCEDNIHVALEPVDARNFTRPDKVAACIDRAANAAPQSLFSDGGENELMLVRVCINVDPIFPTTGIGAQIQHTPGSGYQMVSTAAFVNEPNT